MAGYLMKYRDGYIKDKYRLEANYDIKTHDVPRDNQGNINPSYDDVYIACRGGSQIYHYGGSILVAYIPSIIKGNNILKMVEEKCTPITNIEVNDKEVSFYFNVKYVDEIATMLRAKTLGKGTSPYSIKRLPKNKNVSIPTEKIAMYKEITSQIKDDDKLLISRVTNSFLNDVLQRKYKDIDVKADMKRLDLARQPREYLLMKGEFDSYLLYLRKKIKEHYKDKEKHNE